MCNLVHCGRIPQSNKKGGEECPERLYIVDGKKLSPEEFEKIPPENLVNFSVTGNQVSCDVAERSYVNMDSYRTLEDAVRGIENKGQKGTNPYAKRDVREAFLAFIKGKNISAYYRLRGYYRLSEMAGKITTKNRPGFWAFLENKLEPYRSGLKKIKI